MKAVVFATSLLALSLVQASAQGCTYQKSFNKALQGAGITEVRIQAAAGDLQVLGSKTSKIQVKGQACTNTQNLLGAFELETEVQGNVLLVTAHVPKPGLFQNAGLHLNLSLPERLKVQIIDTSGDILVRGVQDVEIEDDSGDIEVSNIRGNVYIPQDGSGDLTLRQIQGKVTIDQDGSGDLTVDGAASVDLQQDDSGDLLLRHIRGNVTIGRDNSGDITVQDIGGNFVVRQDGSGRIHASGVKGRSDYPRKD